MNCDEMVRRDGTKKKIYATQPERAPTEKRIRTEAVDNSKTTPRYSSANSHQEKDPITPM
jgi:hypothetical protein